MNKFEVVNRPNGNLTYYKMPVLIKIGYCSSILGPAKELSLEEIFTKDPLRTMDHIELLEDPAKGVNHVCVSNAHTHIEKLVFPAFMIRNNKTKKEYLVHRNNNIEGVHTMLIHGGDPKTIEPDETYLERLVKLNT